MTKEYRNGLVRGEYIRRAAIGDHDAIVKLKEFYPELGEVFGLMLASVAFVEHYSAKID